MAKNFYLRKLDPKLIPIYAAAVLLVIYASPVAGSPLNIAGVAFFVAGLLIRFWAAGYLAKNERLVTSGPYNYVKNPLYCGTFCITVGLCLMSQGPVVSWKARELVPMILLGIFLIFFLAYYAPYKMKVEYERLRRLFPGEWDAYEKAVPSYIPNFRRYREPAQRWEFSAFLKNSEHWTQLSVIVLAILIHQNKWLVKLLGY